MMSLKQRIFRKLYYLLLKQAGKVPERSHIKLNDSKVHFSVIMENVTLGGFNVISEKSKLLGEVKLGKYTTLGNNVILHGGEIRIGNYCQFGPFSSVYSIEHPLNTISIFNSKDIFDGRLKLNSVSEPTEIGDGVWIGHGAIILKGCKIGNGSVIGANSVVTQDVEPYAIYVGNPARLIKFRFTNKIIDLLENSKWWKLSQEELKPYEELFSKDLNGSGSDILNQIKKINQHD